MTSCLINFGTGPTLYRGVWLWCFEGTVCVLKELLVLFQRLQGTCRGHTTLSDHDCCFLTFWIVNVREEKMIPHLPCCLTSFFFVWLCWTMKIRKAESSYVLLTASEIDLLWKAPERPINITRVVKICVPWRIQAAHQHTVKVRSLNTRTLGEKFAQSGVKTEH